MAVRHGAERWRRRCVFRRECGKAMHRCSFAASCCGAIETAAHSIPILIATAIELIGSLAIDSLAQWNLLDDWLLFSGWLILLLPSLGVMIRDLRRSALEQQPITFSISHAIYFAACLYRVSYRAAAFSIGCQSLLNRHFESDPTLAALLAQLAHQLCFTSIHALAKLTLQLVGIQNAFAHLLFPFHFFDVASNYAFFAIRDTFRDGFTTAWGASVALLQVNIILRNSGTWDGLVAILLRRLDLLEKSQTGPSDVLFGLQFFARLAIQFDLADLTAMVAVPSLVSFFVWRDGWFVLHGTGVEVRSCDLLNVWLHFLVLMVIKPVSFWIARRILERKMALTLLGRSTVHGKSSIAKERTGQLFHRLLHQATMRNISVSSRSMLSLNSTSKLLGGAKSMLASTKNLLAYGNPRGLRAQSRRVLARQSRRINCLAYPPRCSSKIRPCWTPRLTSSASRRSARMSSQRTLRCPTSPTRTFSTRFSGALIASLRSPCSSSSLRACRVILCAARRFLRWGAARTRAM